MKKYALYSFVLLSLTLFSCDVAELLKPPSESATKFKIKDPAEKLSDSQLQSLGLQGLTGTPEEIANHIYQWQKQYMINKGFNPYDPRGAYTLRWNTILPGIFPVSEIVVERREEGKIYGTCWDYAAVFIAVARAYNLEVRMTAIKETYPGVPSGMPWAEYEELKKKLQKANVSFTYNQLNSAIKVPYKHYRAEVKLDGLWVPKDASVDGDSPPGNYQEYKWDELADPNLTTR